jgi:hypothetical protein
MQKLLDFTIIQKQLLLHFSDVPEWNNFFVVAYKNIVYKLGT